MLPMVAMLGNPSGGGSPDLLTSLIPFALIIVVFYLLLIRPQQKKQREHEKMLKEIKKGDQVITSGGMHGTVVSLTDDLVVLRIADNVKVTFSRNVIAAIKGSETE